MDKVGNQICPKITLFLPMKLIFLHKINPSFSLNINQYLYKYLTYFCHGNAVITILTTFI